MNDQMIKEITTLEEKDYQQHPVWTWWDDDCNKVEPVDYQPYLPEDHDALFVYTSLIFNDKTQKNAVLSLRLSDRAIYLLSFFNGEKVEMDFSFQKFLFTTTEKRKLESFLGKTVEEIFPIRFSTPFKFEDGDIFSGEIQYKSV